MTKTPPNPPSASGSARSSGGRRRSWRRRTPASSPATPSSSTGPTGSAGRSPTRPSYPCASRWARDPLTPEAEAARILVEDRGHVRIVTFNRPESRNAFDVAMYRACASALSGAQDNDDVRAVVITGRGSAFSAGQDLNEMRAFASGTAESDGASGFPVLLDIVQSFPKPLLAAVNGVAVGLGFTILAHCDLVVVADDARFKVPFTELGVPAEAGSTYLFPMRMGWQRAAKVLFTSEWLSADDVVSAGIAIERCPRGEVVDRTLALADHIASLSPDSVQAIKRLMVEAHLSHVVAARRREETAFAELLPRLAGGAG